MEMKRRRAGSKIIGKKLKVYIYFPDETRAFG